jgi:murein DD-endopeptidase MepM/ murein hydrolase activator NlpD
MTIVVAGSSARERGVRLYSRLGSALVGLALAGCSADVMRLDSPASFGFNDKPSAVAKPMASMSRAGTQGAAPSSDTYNEPYTPPRSNRGQDINVAALPEATGTASAPSAAWAQPKALPPVQSSAPPASAAPKLVKAGPVAQPAAEKGDAFEVVAGDTLFGLSKKYHVSINELMSVNGLTSPALKPGQTLHLPVGKNTSKKPLTRPTEAPAAVAAAPASAAPAADVLAKYNGSYTVKKGDSLSTIAREMKVPVAELQQVNAITDVRKVKPGATLKVPAGSAATTTVAAGEPPKVPAAVVAKESAATIPSSTQPVLLNGSERKVAAVTDTATDAGSSAAPVAATPKATEASAAPNTKVAQAAPAAVAAAGATKLRWPVKGKVIANFGPRPDGTHNDGVNLSVPMGTEVHAAESGVVAYAGSELKGYGNLILVRHDNGWITAYAHTEEMLAKRGDKVKRGQVIAKAGKSGQVDQPQVHFELRQGSKPVDPTPFMDKL